MPTRDESLIQSIDDCSDILHMLHSGSAHNNINTEDEFAVGPARPNAGGNRANVQDIGPAAATEALDELQGERILRLDDLSEAVLVPTLAELEPKWVMMTEKRAIAELKRYLSKHPKLRECMVWGDGLAGWDDSSKFEDKRVWKSYDDWPVALQSELHSSFAKMMVSSAYRGKQLSLDPAKISYTYKDIKIAYLTMVAHALFIEICKIVPWRLHEFTKEHLSWLLDVRYLAYSFRIDRALISYDPGHPGYQFGVVEKINSAFSSGPDFFPLPTQVTPADPYNVFTKVHDEMLVKNAQTPREAINLIARWVQDNVAHGSNTYTRIFKNVAGTRRHYPPMEMILFEKLDASQRSSLLAGLSSESNLRRIGLPKNLKPEDLVDKNGVVADPALKGQAGFIGFTRHCLYRGCTSGAGLLQWLFRSINLPAKSFASYLGPGQTGNYPNAFHRGIEVSDGSIQSIAIPHADDLYQVTASLHRPSPPFLNFLDPHIDLSKTFWPKDLMRLYLPDYPTSGLKASDARDREQAERYSSWMTLVGACYGFSNYVIPWWSEWERVGRQETKMDEANIQWISDLKKLSNPLGSSISSAISLAQKRVKDRILEIEAGKNTLWGTRFADYKAGYENWCKRRIARSIRYKIWQQ